MLKLQIEPWSAGGVVIRVQGEHEHYGSVWGSDFTLEPVDSTKGVDKLTLHGPNGIVAILSGVVTNEVAHAAGRSVTERPVAARERGSAGQEGIVTCGQCRNWKRYEPGSPWGECQAPLPENIPAWALLENHGDHPPLLPTNIHEGWGMAGRCSCFAEITGKTRRRR